MNSEMSKLATIYGGSGFVGRYIAKRLADEGWRVRVAVRRPNEAIHVKTYGVPGQVEPVLCNIRNDDSVRVAMSGADAVVNCVGTFDKSGKNNFNAVQHVGAESIARIASEESVDCMVHISAIGADLNSESVYCKTKAMGEIAVTGHFPDAVILRPSVIFGPEDGFFNRFASMARFGPILPIVGADSRFQPVYVDNVAEAAVRGATGEAEPGTYELGGPEVRSFRALVNEMLTVIRRRRLVLNIPFRVASVMGFFMELAQTASFGFISAMITRDQVASLRSDTVVGENSRGLRELGIQPVAIGTVLPDYLWRFRPAGQYEAIKESAKNLRA